MSSSTLLSRTAQGRDERDAARRRGSNAARATLLAVLLAAPFAAAAGAVPREEKAGVELHLDRTAYAPGDTARLATVLRIEDGWHVNSNTPTYDYLIPTTVEVRLPEGWPAAEVSYPAAKTARFTFAEEPLSVYEGTVAATAALRVPPDAAAGESELAVSVTYQACNDTQCLPPVEREESVVLRVGGGGEAARAGWFAADGAATDGGAGGGPERAMGAILALALLGGLILNAMPCVLPVLSIKVFSLVKASALSRRDVTLASLATSSGILVSFWALAAAALLARRAGAAVGWGVQFQQPAFVAFLAVIVVLFALNLWGVFEIHLPHRLARLAGEGRQEGLAGHFVTGLFATLMATPCSAPFLGTAVGFALAQPAPVVLAVFTAVGVGMALPYLLLAAWPRAAGLLPRPGNWMVRLKEVMGFLLAAAAIWLFYVLASQVSAGALAAVQVALLGLALALWLRRAATTSWARRATVAGALLAAAATVAVAASAPAARAVDGPKEGLIAWIEWNGAEAERLAAAGTPVFVDVTAEWCFTCKVNEQLVLDTPPVAEAFREAGVVAMKADWTNRDPAIGELLAAHGRYGIPFYLLHRPGARPHVFPELLTQDAVVDAVREAGRRAER